jgi:surface polysaccharide O-acyltransferase-like enzyme
VDFIRTFAIILVVLVHTTAFPYRIPDEITSAVTFNWFTVDIFAAVANMAVPLFVMLSGALLLDTAKADEPMKVFYKKRFARIGIPMIFWTVIYFGWYRFVTGQPLTVNTVLSGLLSGSYYHLWFVYLLIGLYLATPFLRILIKHLSRQQFKFMLIVWFVGNVTVPLINQFFPFGFNPVMFILTGWVGYYLLGTYLLQAKVPSWKAWAGVVVGLVSTVVGAWWVTGTYGQSRALFFDEPLNTTLILASTSVFLLLIAIPKSRFGGCQSKLCGVLHWIGQNTLPIYFFHIIIMETIQSGFLGFSLNQTLMSPIFEIPLLTVITLAVTAALVYPLKKIPLIRTLIG